MHFDACERSEQVVIFSLSVCQLSCCSQRCRRFHGTHRSRFNERWSLPIETCASCFEPHVKINQKHSEAKARHIDLSKEKQTCSVLRRSNLAERGLQSLHQVAISVVGLQRFKPTAQNHENFIFNDGYQGGTADPTWGKQMIATQNAGKPCDGRIKMGIKIICTAQTRAMAKLR
jgi:hypothetical protein